MLFNIMGVITKKLKMKQKWLFLGSGTWKTGEEKVTFQGEKWHR